MILGNFLLHVFKSKIVASNEQSMKCIIIMHSKQELGEIGVKSFKSWISANSAAVVSHWWFDGTHTKGFLGILTTCQIRRMKILS